MASRRFFRSVRPHVITQDDLDDESITVPTGTAVGDSGIVFVSDYNETDDGDEILFFVPIKADVDVTGKYFRSVESHIITQDDLDNEDMSKPTGTTVGDSGLVFTADNNETDDGDEKKYFVPIKIEKPDTAESIDDNTPTNKIPTVAAVISYVSSVMQDKVSFEIDGEGSVETSDGELAFPTVYSEEEVRIGTWENKPLYRRIISGTTQATASSWAVIRPEITNITLIRTGGYIYDNNLPGLAVIPNDAMNMGVNNNYKLCIYVKSAYVNANYTCIIEYTKNDN